MEDIRRGSAEAVPAIGIVPIPLYPFRWNGNAVSVFLAFCVNVTVNEFDLSRVAVRIIATAGERVIGQVPFLIKNLVQKLIPPRVVPRSLALYILRSDSHRQLAVGTALKEEFAWKIQGAASLPRNSESTEVAAGFSS
jgi:hypothetical protein